MKKELEGNQARLSGANQTLRSVMKQYKLVLAAVAEL
jgi:hypothetical protein